MTNDVERSFSCAFLCVCPLGESDTCFDLRYLVGFAAFQGPEFLLLLISSRPIWNPR